jgi:hypothetical protein
MIVFDFIFAILIVISFSFQDKYENISYIILLGLPIALLLTGKNIFESKTYIINYLDDIFYQRDESSNNYYKFSFIIRTISVLAIFYYTSLYTNIANMNGISREILGPFAFAMMILLFSFILAILELSKKYELKIYDDEIYSYKSTKLFLLTHFCIVSFAILLVVDNLSNYLELLIVSIILFLLNGIDFYLVSKSFGKYYLVYQKDEDKPRKLFSK